ncbi:hypothetical protein V5799_017099 [Amblyomma americanum]|uniref:Uncharacterized protein n=1 Tax=Amblyomma americanum TaxID=6943 RepID=A0AAQ4F497_AMBAM
MDGPEESRTPRLPCAPASGGGGGGRLLEEEPCEPSVPRAFFPRKRSAANRPIRPAPNSIASTHGLTSMALDNGPTDEPWWAGKARGCRERRSMQ